MAKMSLEDLRKLRENTQQQIKKRDMDGKQIQIIVGMGTCGIAAGARDVLVQLAHELGEAQFECVTLRQSGCVGRCDQEPMLTYTDKAGRDYLYVQLTRQKAREFVAGHIVGGGPVDRYILEGGK